VTKRRFHRYFVGYLGSDVHDSVHTGRDAREAVRNWCLARLEAFPGFARETLFDTPVWTAPVLACSVDGMADAVQHWSIDASQPPAWIITPYRGEKEG
jgi:hypothetical protein